VHVKQCDSPNFKYDSISEARFLSKLDFLRAKGVLSRKVLFYINILRRNKQTLLLHKKKQTNRREALKELIKFAN